jgi:signal transduction histidine kinase
VARRENLVSLLSVPLLFSGKAIGALNVYTDRQYLFSNDEIRVLSALAELSAIAIEKARLHERIVDAEEQLRQKEKLSALGWLAAEVAHEIRNPLTVLKMLYHSLELQFPEGDPRNQDARIIADKIEHMNRIVERILDFARNVEPEFVPVDLNGIVEELGLLVRHKASQQGIRLECRLQQGLPAVSGDRTQLEQAFLNIVLNAAEAMPRGGSLVIATREQPSPGRSPQPGVVVEFADTGQGIRPVGRKAGKVSMLNTTKKRGTGIGLAIVHRVVEAHHGRVMFSSRPGEGTVVTVWLPRQGAN